MRCHGSHGHAAVVEEKIPGKGGTVGLIGAQVGAGQVSAPSPVAKEEDVRGDDPAEDGVTMHPTHDTALRLDEVDTKKTHPSLDKRPEVFVGGGVLDRLYFVARHDGGKRDWEPDEIVLLLGVANAKVTEDRGTRTN